MNRDDPSKSRKKSKDVGTELPSELNVDELSCPTDVP